MNVVFMGTPGFAVPTLEKLHEKGYTIKLVITQPDRPYGRGKKIRKSDVKIKAEKLGLEIFQPEKVKIKEAVDKIKNVKPDIIVVVAFGQILSKDILNIPKFGCINVHASILPKLRGSAPINWAIINGFKKTGVTTMFMDEGIDSGDILLTSETKITKFMNAGKLHDILMVDGAELLIKTIEEIKAGTIDRKKQNNEEATYAPIMKKSLGHINWNNKAEIIHNIIRGLYPWPGAYFKYNGSNVKVFSSDYYLEENDYIEGTVFKINNEGIYVYVQDGVVIIKEIQMPGKKRMKIKDYLLGNSFPTNIVLE